MAQPSLSPELLVESGKAEALHPVLYAEPVSAPPIGPGQGTCIFGDDVQLPDPALALPGLVVNREIVPASRASVRPTAVIGEDLINEVSVTYPGVAQTVEMLFTHGREGDPAAIEVSGGAHYRLTEVQATLLGDASRAAHSTAEGAQPASRRQSHDVTPELSPASAPSAVVATGTKLARGGTGGGGASVGRTARPARS